MPSPPRAEASADHVPPGFRVDRSLPVGRHPLLKAFPGLDRLATARRQVADAKRRKALFERTMVELVSDDLWMYVAPQKKIARYRQWSPVVTPDLDCIVVGRDHLVESPALTLFLDIFHELCHVLQRQDGAELFDTKVSYVRKTTEVEAYRFVIGEARVLGVEDTVLREYLRVEWISDAEHEELLNAVGVSPG
jgi:hypothetical protein